MSNPLTRLAKRLNWSRRAWSTDRDREFHDAVFAGKTYDPFSPGYPGFLTIRRFADLAEAHVRPTDTVFDLGCGPGEITCELARRIPTATFVGVDHSAEAIARASQLGTRLGLTNIRFERHDLEGFMLPHAVDLVMMFDAFHHVLDPDRFLAAMGEQCGRFFLIEPAGNALGQWERAIDLDWLSEALFTIRDRLEYQAGLQVSAPPSDQEAAPAGEPTERRYSMEDFVRFFAGFGVEVRGTIAGLELYGVEPHATSPLRDDIGQVAYRLVVDLEDMLRSNDLDLAAKHWAIYAERGRPGEVRRVPDLPKRTVQTPLSGAYGATYEHFDGALEVCAGTMVSATVSIRNQGWRQWDSTADQPVLLSYHWLDTNGRTVVEDGLRNPLPRIAGPGESVSVALQIQCPDTPGKYVLALDLIHEHVTWFSRAGVPPLKVPVRVRSGTVV